MRSITLNLTNEQFVEIYAMSAGYFVSSPPEDGSPITEAMKELRARCIEIATPEEYANITQQCENIAQVFQQDSPDKYIAVAGMKGMIEQLNNKLSA